MSRARLYAVMAVIALTSGILVPVAASILGWKLGWTVQTTQQPSPQEVVNIVPVYVYPIEGTQEKATKATYVATTAGARSFNDYDELRSFLALSSQKATLEDKLRRNVRDFIILPLVEPALEPVQDLLATRVLITETATPTAQVAQASGVRVSTTNVQVPGVDELDIVKSDGRLIFVASSWEGRSSVFVVDAEARRVASMLRAPIGETVKGLFLLGDRLVVVSESGNSMVIPEMLAGLYRLYGFHMFNVNTTVRVYDVADPYNPSLLGKVTLTGSLVSGRMYNGVVYLVVNQPVVVGSAFTIPFANGAPLPPQSIVAVSEDAGRYVNILALNVSSLAYTAISAIGGPATTIYMSYDKLYIASTRGPSLLEAYSTALRELASILGGEDGEAIASMVAGGDILGALERAREILSRMDDSRLQAVTEKLRSKLSNTTLSDSTVVTVFRVEGLKVEPIGSVKVEGKLLDQFAINEYMGDYLVIATTTTYYSITAVTFRLPTPMSELWPRTIVVECSRLSTQPPVCNTIEVRGGNASKPLIEPPRSLTFFTVSVYPKAPDALSNTVTIVDVRDMKIVGRLAGIAPGERIYAARLVKNILFLVTFRVVDPLFAIDISNPEEPVILGFLKIPGFSEYLHPLPGDLLLGVGRQGVDLKISLFNASNPTDMKEIATIIIMYAESPVLRDHHAITVDLELEQAYIPVTNSAFDIAIVSFKEGKLKLVATLNHPGASRTVYIGEELYTISPYGIVIYDLKTFKEIAVIKFYS